MTDIAAEIFGTLPDGRTVQRYTLSNRHLTITLLDYGVRLQSVSVPLPAGVARECVLGFESLDEYLHDTAYIGAVVGRFANRIRDAQFVINGTRHKLERNEGAHHLHGGKTGFHDQLWHSEILDDAIVFSLTSADGASGYPGCLKTRVIVRLIDDRVVYRFEAMTDKPTHINITNHSYFNLDDKSTTDPRSVLDHQLQIAANQYVETDSSLLPTGRFCDVEDTVYDFSALLPVGHHFASGELIASQGYDLCYILRGEPVAAKLISPDGLITLTVATSEPGIQLYTGNFLAAKHTGLCLETQHFPDSPNMPHFPDTALQPGDLFSSTTSLRFAVTG